MVQPIQFSLEGVNISPKDPVIRKLDFDNDVPVKVYPPTPNPKVVAKFKRWLAKVRAPRKPKPKTSPLGFKSNPHSLRPIGLKSCIIKDHHPIKKPTLIRSKPIQERGQPAQATIPRRKNLFVDDSAIESDGEGGDINSVSTTPERTERKIHFLDALPAIPRRPAAPPVVNSDSPAPVIDIRTPSPSRVTTAPKSKTICDLCDTILSGPEQLKKHRNSKKCRKKANRKSISNKELKCSTCSKAFLSIHNLHTHKCQ